MDTFKKINGFPNYSASDSGLIINDKTKKIIKPMIAKTGYAMVDLCNKGMKKRFLVHRLILSSFEQNKELKPQANHKNGIKSDNRLENLEWNTRSENQKHSIKIGLRTAKGVKNSQCKLTEQNVLDIFFDKNKYTEICKNYNVSISTIYDIKKGYSWTHITGLENKKQDNRKQVLKTSNGIDYEIFNS